VIACMFSSSGFIDRGDIDELVCNMLRSELLKRYALSNKRSRDYMAGLIRATPDASERGIGEYAIRNQPIAHGRRKPLSVRHGDRDDVFWQLRCRSAMHHRVCVVPSENSIRLDSQHEPESSHRSLL